MRNLFHSLADLLGKRIDDPTVLEFLQFIGESPDVEKGEWEECTYFFPVHGFSFSYDPLIGHIWTVDIYCLTPDAWAKFHRGCKAFVGSLPASISCTDDRASVQSKVGKHPIETYTERAPAVPPEFSEEQKLAFVTWLRDQEAVVLPEVARPVHRWWEERENMPDEIVVDVYNAGRINWHFFFLIKDQSLLEVRLYIATSKSSAPQ